MPNVVLRLVSNNTTPKSSELGDTFDFADIKPDDKTADEADFNIWQQNFGADPTSAAELNGSITWLDPSLDEVLGTIELKDSGDDLII